MNDKQYTIKDIARMAGVSTGTVDRVLHQRGEVSESSKQKVEKILKEISYQPNMYAIGLARKKKYQFVCFIPKYRPDDYWHSVALGIERAIEEVRPFNILFDFVYYDHSDRESFVAAGKELLKHPFDAVLMAPNYAAETLEVTRRLSERDIPFAFIDVNVEGAGALSYIGQDSFRSGYIAARILDDNRVEGQEIALFHTEDNTKSQEIQMQRRLQGFNAYLAEKRVDMKLHDVVLTRNEEEDEQILVDFRHHHPQVTCGVVFNSRIYRVGEYLAKHGLSLKRLIGYDLLPRNVALLKAGVVDYLIGQRPGLQGYGGVKVLVDKVVFKRDIDQQRYMPVDILIKENIDYYVESYNL